MDKKKSRDPKDQMAFLKEWVSDNLRYILLAAAIIIIVLIIIFALTSSPIKNDDKSSTGKSSPVIETSSVSENGIATEDKNAAGTENKSASTADATSALSAEEKSEETQLVPTEGASENAADASKNEPPVGSQLTVASPEISATVETYLNALAANDVDSAASVSENLNESEIAAISQGVYPSPIEHIVVYAFPGAEDGNYVAIARFDATDRNTLVSVPAAAAYYLITADTGDVLIASADTTAAHQGELDEVVAYPAVAQLITDVSNQAQAVLASAGQ